MKTNAVKILGSDIPTLIDSFSEVGVPEKFDLCAPGKSIGRYKCRHLEWEAVIDDSHLNFVILYVPNCGIFKKELNCSETGIFRCQECLNLTENRL